MDCRHSAKVWINEDKLRLRTHCRRPADLHKAPPETPPNQHMCTGCPPALNSNADMLALVALPREPRDCPIASAPQTGEVHAAQGGRCGEDVVCSFAGKSLKGTYPYTIGGI